MTQPRAAVRAALAIVLVSGIAVVALRAQASRTPAEIGNALRGRYDIVSLQRGVALVPREARAGIRMIQVVDGVVVVDGETVTGRQLTDRLGADAPLIVQLSYLDAAAQREVTGAASAGGASGAGGTAPPAPAEPTDVPVVRTQVQEGDIVRIGGDVTVTRDERVTGDVVVIGGSADIDGEVTGDLAVIMGSLHLGPNAVVRGDVAAVAGRFNREPGARVFGRIADVGAGGRGARRGRMVPGLFGSFWSRAGSFAATALRITLLILLGLAAVALGRTPVERIAARAAAGPLRAGLIGLLAEILFVPVLVITVVVLAISIVGIPLLALVPFGIVLMVVLMLVGFIGLAYHVGGYLTGRLGWSDRSAYAAVTVGVLAIVGLTLVARLASLAGGFLVGAPLSAVGYLVEYAAWTIGFGATILALFDAQRGMRSTAAAHATPPPLPGEA